MTRRAVVTGMIATLPFGGVAWDYGQYALGLEELGFEVTYLEDTGLTMLDPSDPHYTTENPAYGIAFLTGALRSLSPTLASRWHVRTPDGRTFGMTADELNATVAEADVFLNVSGACRLTDAYLPSPRKVLIDTDPGWNHFVTFPRSLAGHDGDAAPFTRHDTFLTYAENLGRPQCRLPDFGLRWLPTRPPVVVDRWTADGPGERWTTVLSWANYSRQVVDDDGVEYGSKDHEFPIVEDLPNYVQAPLELAAGGVKPPIDRWRERGWSVVDSTMISRTLDDYRDYIQRSRGELSVAKNVYVATRSGWFSCRSACYLAAGRPVVLQDTGFSDHLPVGKGLLAFSTTDEAVQAIEAVEADPAGHGEGARALAVEHLAADRILGDLLDAAGVT